MKKQISRLNDELAFFLSKNVQSHDVFDFLLLECERADKMIISSFAVTEAYVRRIIRNRDKIGELTLILDFTIASRNPRLTQFAAKNVDDLLLTTNHSKTIYIQSGTREYLAIMSNNATNNHRYECGIITSAKEVIDQYKKDLGEMINNCVQWQ
jgi:hypothetical protein